MLTKELAQGIYVVPLGFVNVFLIDREELTLIDTGIPGSDAKIIKAIQELGHQAKDLRHILISHLHEDHVGGLPALKQVSGAQVYMHHLDAEAYIHGDNMRTIEPSPGWVNSILVKAISRQSPAKKPETVAIHQHLYGDEHILNTGGASVLHAPGHTCGHLVFTLPLDGGIVFLGDAAAHFLRLGYSFLYEDFRLGKETLAKIGQLQFETACFSHGKPIIGKASEIIKRRFSNGQHQ